MDRILREKDRNMSDSMLREEIKVYSDKYDISGVIKNYGMAVILFFSYVGRKHEIGIERNLFNGETYEELGRSIIESYIENFAKYDTGRKQELHYWYIEECTINNKIIRIGNGIVTGHAKIPDSCQSYTSAIEDISVDENEGILLMRTRNSTYTCLLENCDFHKQDQFPELIPGYEEIKKKYKNKIKYPTIGPGNVLLVFSDYCEYYFHSIFYIPKGSKKRKPLEYQAYAHVGTFQDSFLICVEDTEIDIRYWPHSRNIEFYHFTTEGNPVYLENIGGCVLYARFKNGMIKLEPGERKEVKKENYEESVPVLPGGDLYPPMIISTDN